ncbi:hypothetical protein KBP30_00675 [Streptomyces sp. Go40/10]|uniref:hypothetical protein n=1 Tax=Streptomyces sp. Go40/10 TaxID=2825844 RepID=UPI001E5F6568|nr:hypothetical protein [Streptomyces sp. Go40/10]UFQ99837.1 hypothetical protein KBP30_00675 [Streptomyces sp. Go40/10]
MHTFTVTERDVTQAWVAACNKLDRKDNPDRTGLHTVVRIADPTNDDPVFRAELDRLRTARGLWPLETVASTLFPAALAARSAGPDDLAERYRQMYPVIKRYPGNHRGTYFGRLVSYPAVSKSGVDQLGTVINRLRAQASGTKIAAAYEIDIAAATDAEEASAGLLVHAAGKDNSYIGFPCLSHISLQLDRERRVHAAALYRSHFMFERAYGNYLGLGRLLAYIAQQAELACGTLTVMAGHARLDGPITQLRPLLTGTGRLAA